MHAIYEYEYTKQFEEIKDVSPLVTETFGDGNYFIFYVEDEELEACVVHVELLVIMEHCGAIVFPRGVAFGVQGVA